METSGESVSSEPAFFDSVDAAFAAAEASSAEETAEEAAEPEATPTPEPAEQDAKNLDDDDDDEPLEAAKEEKPAEEKEEKPAEEKGDEKEKEEKKGFLTIKVNGEERQISEEQARILAQKGLAADEKFQEAAKFRKQTELLVKTLKENPVAVLEHPHIGLQFRKLAEDYLYETFLFESKSPEEQEAIIAKRKLAQYEAAEKQRLQDARDREEKQRQEEQKRKLEASTQFYLEKFSKELDAEVEASGIPDVLWAKQRAIMYMKKDGLRGLRPSAKATMDYVKQDYAELRKRSVENMSPEQLLEYLGEENLKKVKKFQLEKKRQLNIPPGIKPQSAPSINSRKTKKQSGYHSSTNEIFG